MGKRAITISAVFLIMAILVVAPHSLGAKTKVVSGKVTAIDGSGEAGTRITLNKGSSDNLKEGTRGYVGDGESAIAYLKVVSVKGDSATAVITKAMKRDRTAVGMTFFVRVEVPEEESEKTKTISSKKYPVEPEFIIKPQFDDAEWFSEGLAKVKIGDKYGYIDKSGGLVINPQFDDAGYFNEGLASVKIGDKAGYMDKTGKVVINPQFDTAGWFSEGLAGIEIGDKWGYIDKNGKVVITPQFDYAKNFSENIAAVKTGGKWGYIKNPLK